MEMLGFGVICLFVGYMIRYTQDVGYNRDRNEVDLLIEDIENCGSVKSLSGYHHDYSEIEFPEEVRFRTGRKSSNVWRPSPCISVNKVMVPLTEKQKLKVHNLVINKMAAHARDKVTNVLMLKE